MCVSISAMCARVLYSSDCRCLDGALYCIQVQYRYKLIFYLNIFVQSRSNTAKFSMYSIVLLYNAVRMNTCSTGAVLYCTVLYCTVDFPYRYLYPYRYHIEYRDTGTCTVYSTV